MPSAVGYQPTLASEMGQLQENMVLAGKISMMVHEIQKERGMSAGYLGSKGEKFASEIIKQRRLTDKRITDLLIHSRRIANNSCRQNGKVPVVIYVLE